MRIGIIAVLAFITLICGMYIYSLKAEADETYTNFKKLRAQNCEFLAQFLSIKQCNELIAYKFKTVVNEPPYFKANENYIFFYQLQLEDATQFDKWFAQQIHKGLIYDDELELFSASRPKQSMHFLPELRRYCLDLNQSCMGRFWRVHDNDDFQRNSYIVYADDRKYWTAVQQRDFQCGGNIEIDQQAFRPYLPHLFQRKLREIHYLVCWEKQRRLLRIASVMTEVYLH